MSRHLQLVADGPTRACTNPDCHLAGEQQPWSRFSVRAKHEDGSTAAVTSRCRVCLAAESRERAARRKVLEGAEQAEARLAKRRARRLERLQSDPDFAEREREYHAAYCRWRRSVDPVADREANRERQRRFRAKVAQDPERRAEYRAKRAAYQRQRAARIANETGGHMPIGPFRRWLCEQLAELDPAHAYTLLSEKLGTHDRTVRAWLRERDLIQLDVLDAALCHFGEPGMLRELYPELYEFGDDAGLVAA